MKPELIANNPVASEAWDTLKSQLDASGKWRDEYAAAFAVLVDAIAGFLDASEKLTHPDNKPILVNPRKGTTYRNPLLDIKAGHVNTINRFGSAFGLTPLADAKLKATPADSIGELLQLMGGPPGQ